MDIVLALLRTLIFVVATVAATIYVGRRIGRGHVPLWSGSMLLVLYWLIDFGWTSYRAGAPDATPDAAGWVSWLSHLLPFLAALSFIWGIVQAGVAPVRRSVGHGGKPASGMPSTAPVPADAAGSAAPYAPSAPVSRQPVQEQPMPGYAPPPTGSGPTGAVPGQWGGPSGGAVVSPRVAPASAPGAHTPTQPHRHKPRPPGLIVPHAVPVVMTPSASHHSPLDPDPVVDLGPEDDDPTPPVATLVPPPETCTDASPADMPASDAPADPVPTSPAPASGWQPVSPRPPASGVESPSR
ncbi:MAG: hypothetical protein QM619_13320 [Micropruina sp.]|uniref:hypothetical protein n=1 Tax=Micropruina sp. TaxID=2737536 RepID=UPI0039E51574